MPADLYASPQGSEDDAEAPMLHHTASSELSKDVPELALDQFEFSNPSSAAKRAHRARLSVKLNMRRKTRTTPAGRLLDEFRRSQRGWLRRWRGRTAGASRRAATRWSAL